jgi:hypothetical protein
MFEAILRRCKGPSICSMAGPGGVRRLVRAYNSRCLAYEEANRQDWVCRGQPFRQVNGFSIVFGGVSLIAGCLQLGSVRFLLLDGGSWATSLNRQPYII